MKQANDLGGRINKGEKAHLAVFWKIINAKKVRDEGEEIVQSIPYLRCYNLFNVEQTNLPISVAKNAAQIRAEAESEIKQPIQKAKDLIASMKDIPAIEFNHEKACYIPRLDKILLPHRHLFKADEEFFATVFHELIHGTGHPKRLNRKGIQEVKYGSDQYSKEELIAEIGACFLSNLCGMSGAFDNSAAYIGGWIKALRNDPRKIVYAAGNAEKAVNFLLGAQETPEIDEGGGNRSALAA